MQTIKKENLNVLPGNRQSNANVPFTRRWITFTFANFQEQIIPEIASMQFPTFAESIQKLLSSVLSAPCCPRRGLRCKMDTQGRSSEIHFLFKHINFLMNNFF
jgi:hypothetical protein